MAKRRIQAFEFGLLALALAAARQAAAQDDDDAASTPITTPATEEAAREDAAEQDAAPEAAPAGAPRRFYGVFGPEGAQKTRNADEVSEAPREPRRSIGMLPTQTDFGSEADMVSTANEPHPPPFTRKWNYSLRGYFRAPMRVGLGPRNDGTPGNELHSPPRTVGAREYEWTYTALAPPSLAALYVAVENVRVSGNIILIANTFWDSGYENLVDMGGIAQGYVTLKFPQLFGEAGDLAWNVGAFSNRYGVAGPRQQSSGYYQTYLFGRTHVTGETLVADFRLNPGMSLTLEHGLGAKIEVIPFIPYNSDPPPPRAPFLPEQGPVPQGSTFLHHAHAALSLGDWLTVAAHFLHEWSPNDYQPPQQGRAESAKMTVYGAEVHVDDDVTGHGYLGYSHVKARDILPLSDAVEVIHSTTGLSFTENYINPIDPAYYTAAGITLPTPLDSGDVDTILFQYLYRLGPTLGWPKLGPDVSFAVFGMWNHVSTIAIEQDRLKFGGEVSAKVLPFLSAGVRFDRVSPDGSNSAVAFSALSPRIIIHTNWLNREYVILNYTRYFLGDEARPSRPYDNLTVPDPNLFVLSGAVSF